MLSLPQLCQLNAMTFPTANKTMAQLVAASIARELTGQRRNRVFSYDAYLSSNSRCRRTPIPSPPNTSSTSPPKKNSKPASNKSPTSWKEVKAYENQLQTNRNRRDPGGVGGECDC